MRIQSLAELTVLGVMVSAVSFGCGQEAASTGDPAPEPTAPETRSTLPPGHPEAAVPETRTTLPPGHPPPAVPDEGSFDFSDLRPAEDGVTVAGLFDRKAELDGREIVLRAKVVKFNAGILGANWLHVRDGTGEEGSNDLTVTTDASVAVGETVLIRGMLGVDRDIGSGYFFPIIVEDARVTVE